MKERSSRRSGRRNNPSPPESGARSTPEKAARGAATTAETALQLSRPWFLLALLGGVLLILFFKSLDPHQVLFSNDSPLGLLKAEYNRLPDRFSGTWRDLAWLGGRAVTASPDITMLLSTLASPVVFLKIYAPFSLLFLGFSAWLFFRQLNFSPMVCVLGGVAAGLNSHFFSLACWGLGNWNIAAGCFFLAMSAFYAKCIPQFWQRAVLAGLAAGMGVMEGYDVGAILSIYFGLFVIFYALNDETSLKRRFAHILISEALVVLFATLIAAHTMFSLVETQVEGIAEMGQDVQTKEGRWDAATQWSLPKLETLQILVPGLFGYQLSGMVQKDQSSAYWGLIGQDPKIPGLSSDNPVVRSNAISALSETLKLSDSDLADLKSEDHGTRTKAVQMVTSESGTTWRYIGSGECAGTMVSLLAVFGLANFFRKNRPFSKAERLALGFWGLIALFSLMAAWGRYGFFYKYLYALPYFSTIRNPVKFMHPFHIAWVILATYGMEVLSREYIRIPVRRAPGLLLHHLQVWWGKVAGFDRKWTLCMMILAGGSVAAAMAYYAYKAALVRYLEDQTFSPLLAVQISEFSLQQAVIFLFFLSAGTLVVAAILSRAWTSPLSRWAWGTLGVLIVCDLARADIPWINYYDYAEKYAPNPVHEFLLDKPWEHRVAGKLEPRGPGSSIKPGFGQIYLYWLQNNFPYREIQTLDYAQMPRIPDLDRLYLNAFELEGSDMLNTDLRPAVRLWQLTNTRYLLADTASVEFLNRRADPVYHSFKIQSSFKIQPKPNVEVVRDPGDVTAEFDEKGIFGIIEYPRALPRAKLYANWRTPTNDQATLNLLTNQSFEPLNTVLIATNTPIPQANSDSTADPGTVTITDYHPKRVHLEADAKTSAVLLLNDRTGADWHVFIDSAPAPILRCNYIMRGVYLSPGHHTVEFRYQPSLQTLYLSIGAIVLGIILAGYLIVTRKVVPAQSKPASHANDTPTVARLDS